METLSRTNTKVHSLDMFFLATFSVQHGGRQLTTAFERCTCITELKLEFLSSQDDQVEFFQILLVESIPKMLGLKKFDFDIDLLNQQFHPQFFDMVEQYIGGHQGEIEELALELRSASVNTSIVGLTPALRRLKAIRLYGAALTSQQIGELSEGAADCKTLEEFSIIDFESTDAFKAICQLLSKFPSLKRVTNYRGDLPTRRR